MRFLFAILILVGSFAALLFVSFIYDWMRRKMNTPRIGFDYFLLKLLKRGDYVSIKGKVLCFSHVASVGENIDPIRPPFDDNKTIGNELVFDNPHGIGYLFYEPSSLMNCEFIYGEYGLKWALSNQWAKVAEKKVYESIYD